MCWFPLFSCSRLSFGFSSHFPSNEFFKDEFQLPTESSNSSPGFVMRTAELSGNGSTLIWSGGSFCSQIWQLLCPIFPFPFACPAQISWKPWKWNTLRPQHTFNILFHWTNKRKDRKASRFSFINVSFHGVSSPPPPPSFSWHIELSSFCNFFRELWWWIFNYLVGVIPGYLWGSGWWARWFLPFTHFLSS